MILRPLLNFIFALGGLFVATVLSEVALRQYFLGSLFAPIYPAQSSLRESDPILGWKLLPNGAAWYQTFDSSVFVKINSQGHRSPEVSVERTSDAVRAVLLGDSFIEGYSVPYEDSIPGLLPETLGKGDLEVINLGVGGYSSFQQYLSLKEDGARFRPSIVIHFVYPSNDLYENVPELNSIVYGGDPIKIFGRPFIDLSTDPPKILPPDYQKSLAWVQEQRAAQQKQIEDSDFFARTMLWKLFKRADGIIGPNQIDSFDPNIVLGWGHLEKFSAMDARPESGLNEDLYNRLWRSGWNILKWSVLESRKISDSIGAKYLLVNIPAKLQVEAQIIEQLKSQFPNTRLDLNKINRELLAFASTQEIEYLDLLEPLKKSAESTTVYYGWEDRHLNSLGHKIAAIEVANRIKKLAP